MKLNCGGHLTHGAPVNFSGRLYHSVQYGLHPETGLINYDEVMQLAREHKPKMIVAGYSAYSRIVDWKKFREIADAVGAYLFVDMAHIAGLIAAGLYPSPLPFADVVASTTHKTLRGPRGGLILARANEDIEKKLKAAVFPGSQGGPLMHIIAAKAVCFYEALQPEFKNYQAQVIKNACAMASQMQKRGFKLVSDGTDTHLLLMDLTHKHITGKDAEKVLSAANIVVNKNTVPNDPQSPFVTSGLRIGTPAITTRGLKEKECARLADWICDILNDLENQKQIEFIKLKALALCKQFPVYGEK